MPDHTDFVRLALQEALRGEGRTAPAPLAGAVLVRQGVVVASAGRTHPGGPHPAVALALRAQPGDHLYTSLEPSLPGGQPLANASAFASLGRLVVSALDPDPRLRGASLRVLDAAGVPLEQGTLQEQAERDNAAYVTARTRGRPRIVLKAGITLDGRISDHAGASQWITSPEARAAGHGLRATHDAILVGSGTLLADDPSLTTRYDRGRNAQPVVLDTLLRIPVAARVLRAGRPPLVYCANDAPERDLPTAIVCRVPRAARGLDLDSVLSDLLARGIHSVLVEGGGEVHRSLLDSGVVDTIHLFLAPLALAGGRGWLAGAPLALESAARWQLRAVQRVGPDAWLTLDCPRDPPGSHAAPRGRDTPPA